MFFEHEEEAEWSMCHAGYGLPEIKIIIIMSGIVAVFYFNDDDDEEDEEEEVKNWKHCHLCVTVAFFLI